MSLDSEQLDAVRGFLRTNLLFYTSVLPLRHQPFEFPDAPSERGTLEEAAATKPRKGLLRALFLGGSLLTLSGAVWEYLVWRQNLAEKSKEPPPAFTFDYLGRYVMHLLSFNPETLMQQLIHSMPILCMALGLILLLAACCFLVLEVPAHQADPLLARLLQETLRSDSAPSNSYVQSLLAISDSRRYFSVPDLPSFLVKSTLSKSRTRYCAPTRRSATPHPSLPTGTTSSPAFWIHSTTTSLLSISSRTTQEHRPKSSTRKACGTTSSTVCANFSSPKC